MRRLQGNMENGTFMDIMPDICESVSCISPLLVNMVFQAPFINSIRIRILTKLTKLTPWL
jgi:hypothetical protein